VGHDVTVATKDTSKMTIV